MSDYDNGYDEGYRAGMQKMREVGQTRIEELEAKLEAVTTVRELMGHMWGEAEDKLSKAVEAMEFWSQAQEPEIDAAINLMQATLAELKGETDE